MPKKRRNWLDHLHSVRQRLQGALYHADDTDRTWLKHYIKAADTGIAQVMYHGTRVDYFNAGDWPNGVKPKSKRLMMTKKQST